MNTFVKLYKELTSVHWEIGLLENTLEGIIKGEELKLTLISHDFQDSWFADPFILDITNDTIIVLVEEVTKKLHKGRISKLIINRKTYHVIEKKVILERSGHLSFPIIFRRDGDIYIYPENSAEGELNLYKYNPTNDNLSLVHKLSDRPLTDAVITDLFGRTMMFATDAEYANGFQLDQYEWDNDKNQFVFATSFLFKEHIARMAGYFFSVKGKVYRPAQESNTNYGHGISIQETTYKDGKWDFKEVRRLTSPHPILNQSFHTFNSHKGIIIVDVLGKRHPFASNFFKILTTPLRLFRKNKNHEV